MNEVYDCSEMIMKTFSNIERETFEKNNELFKVWKKIITSINKNGEKIYEHSSIVDLKKDMLLVEADHSGWIQLLQMNSRYILKGFSMYAPVLGIKNIVFRLKGSNATLHSVNYEKEFQKAQQNLMKQTEENEKIVKNYENSVRKDNTTEKLSVSEQLPQNLLDKFESLKKSVLTKDKNK